MVHFFLDRKGMLPRRSYHKSFSKILKNTQNNYLAFCGCFRIPSIFDLSTWKFYCNNQIVQLMWHSLSKDRCFHENKHLDMHWDLWQRCLWEHRYHPLVKLYSTQKFPFPLVSSLTKLTFTLLKLILSLIKFEIG